MDYDSTPTCDYRFLQWRYTPEQRLLACPEGEIRLKPLLDRLLRRLLDEPGAVLARERLIEQVWSRRQVNDEVLSRAIAELRATLGDDAREPRFIETLSKGGYRWIAPVVRLEANPGLEISGLEKPARPRGGRFAMAGVAILVLLALIGWNRFQRKDNVGRNHAALAADLLGAQPLTADPRLEYDARFDPLGRVVYIRSERDGVASELVMVDPVSRAERLLWQDTNPLRHPAPSPNGREVAVTRMTTDGCELWSVALLDGHRTRLGNCADSVSGGLEWSDGGDTLLFSGTAIDALHAPGLMQLDRRSGEVHALTSPNAGEDAHVDPRLSSDGKHLVYASVHGDDEQLWKTSWPRIGPATPLLKRPEPVYEHAFVPGTDTLWIAGDLTLFRALHQLMPGGQPELIGGRGARSIDIAANGAAVWSEANYDADIWLRRTTDGPWSVIARSIRYEAQPEFSADGRRVALISNRNGAESILVYDTDKGNTRQLSLDPGFRWVRPTWSARDQSLILTAYEDRETRLYRYELDGDILTALPNVEMGAFQGTELADRLIYLVGHGTALCSLKQLRAGQSTAENIDLGPVAAYRASADWLVWRAPGSGTLRVATLAEPATVREIELTDDGMVEAFALNGSVLVYRDKGQLWSLTLPGGMPTVIATEHVPNGSGPSVAASGTGAIATVTLTSLGMDLMIATPLQAGR